MYGRILDLAAAVKERSLFLLGARQTGKTTLLLTQFPTAKLYSLNKLDTFRELAARPELIRQRLVPSDRLVMIDEIQKLPQLLNEVQVMLDGDPGLRFILAGSSARSLRAGGVNLLGGRARTYHLYPLVSAELPKASLDRRIAYGSLPPVFDSSDPEEDLAAYAGSYLEHEIRAEGLVRSIGSFSRFLEIAATCNGQILNFTEIGSDAGVPPRTVREHFQVLEDTLVGHIVPAYQKTVKRKPVATAKFYFFDAGVARHLARRPPAPRGSPEWGQGLEHIVFLELLAYVGYRRLRKPVGYWRSRGQVEVDFVVGDTVAVEVKASRTVTDRHLGGLRALAEDVPLRARIVVCLESEPRRTDDGISILPAENFFRLLWAGGFDEALNG